LGKGETTDNRAQENYERKHSAATTKHLAAPSNQRNDLPSSNKRSILANDAALSRNQFKSTNRAATLLEKSMALFCRASESRRPADVSWLF
jgi:hypothetical protein